MTDFDVAALVCLAFPAGYAVWLIVAHIVQSRRERRMLDRYAEELRVQQDEVVERQLRDWERRRGETRRSA
jgi:hypothetical protein